MAPEDRIATKADLCQRTIEAADNSMFKYLSFFAAIHAAAFTAIASGRVGYTAYLRAIEEAPPPDPAALGMLTLTPLMAGLCYLVARGLSDATQLHVEAVEQGRKLGSPFDSFFEDVHARPSRPSADPNLLLRGVRRLLPRYARASAAASVVGVLWTLTFLALVWGFPGPLSTRQGLVFEPWKSMTLTLLGVILLVIGIGAVVQTIVQAHDQVPYPTRGAGSEGDAADHD